MRAKDGEFEYYLKDIYADFVEAKKWVDYLRNQKQNEDYDFLLEVVCG
jgi:hypothetical protein